MASSHGAASRRRPERAAGERREQRGWRCLLCPLPCRSLALRLFSCREGDAGFRAIMSGWHLPAMRSLPATLPSLKALLEQRCGESGSGGTAALTPILSSTGDRAPLLSSEQSGTHATFRLHQQDCWFGAHLPPHIGGEPAAEVKAKRNHQAPPASSVNHPLRWSGEAVGENAETARHRI